MVCGMFSYPTVAIFFKFDPWFNEILDMEQEI
jgi:hypothetical protein